MSSCQKLAHGRELNFLNQNPECVFTKGACHIFAYRLIMEKEYFMKPSIGYFFIEKGPIKSSLHHQALHVFVADDNLRYDVRGRFCRDEFLDYWRAETGKGKLKEKLAHIIDYELFVTPESQGSFDNKLGLYSEPEFVKKACALAEDYIPRYKTKLGWV